MQVYKDTIAAMMEVPGALSCAVVEVGSGECLARAGEAVPEDIEKACVINARFLRASSQMADDHYGESIEDVLITLGSQVHLIRLAPRRGETDLFTYLVFAREVVDIVAARRTLAQIGTDLLGAENPPMRIPAFRRTVAPTLPAFNPIDGEALPPFMSNEVAMKLLGITHKEDEVLTATLLSTV